MSMLAWAEQEVKIGKHKENPEYDEELHDFDYGIYCYDSALKAFKSLLDDGHSGTSIHFTKDILIRLIEGRPLTPIEVGEIRWIQNQREGRIQPVVDEDIWNLLTENLSTKDIHNEFKYQCKRMSSLFMYLHRDKEPQFNDVSRVVMKDDDTGSTCYDGLSNRIVNEIYPITFPYSGEIKPYVVTSKKIPPMIDEEVIKIVSITKPSGEVVNIGKLYSYTDKGWILLDFYEYFVTQHYEE